MSLKQRLLAFVVVLLGVVVAALTSLAYQEMREEIVTGVTYEIESAVRGNREAISRWSEQRRDAMSAAAARLNDGATDPRPFLNTGKDAGRFEQTFAGYADKRMLYNLADKKAAEGYDPTSRPWYKLAVEKRVAIATEPYVFASTKKLGITFARAFAVAVAGRPGPVVVALPEDVLFGAGEAVDLPPPRPARAAPPAAAMVQLRTLLAAAQRPLLIAGGSGWDAAAVAALKRFVHANGLPVAASFRRQDLFDNRDAHYIGQLGLGVSPRLAERVRQADLLLVVGSRLAEATSSGYSLFGGQPLIHIHADPDELGRVYPATLPINASPACAAEALAALPPVADPAWRAWTAEARTDYLDHSTPPASHPALSGVDFARVMGHLDTVLPDDAIIANGAGNYTVWVHRFYRYRQPATELAPTNGAMGYGLPAAICAKLEHPERTVVCFAGDGCFMMYPQELATAMQFGAPVVVIVVNNGMLGTIRMHQEREFPGRVAATPLLNPDFVALAQAFGAHAERVERSEDFPAAFARATAVGVPALIELRVDPRQITPQARLTEA